MEEQSSHPLAAAIVQTAMERKLAFSSATNIENLPGKGIQAQVDVVLKGYDLGKLSFAIGLSRASTRIIRQNLVIALGVIVLLVIASLTGVIALSVAVVVHEGSTIVVGLNALRLLVWRERAEWHPGSRGFHGFMQPSGCRIEPQRPEQPAATIQATGARECSGKPSPGPAW